MKTVLCIVIAAVTVGWFAVAYEADAGNHHRHVEKRIVVPFAVPVAVPVAPYSPVTYSNTVVPYTDPPESEKVKELRLLAKMIAAELRGEPISGLAIEQYPLFAQSCAQCHAKGNPELGKPQFTGLAALDGDQIDECMDAILNDRMPQGKKLAPEVNGGLLKELVAAKKAWKAARAAAELPPQPQVLNQAAPQSEAPPIPQPPEEKQ